MENAELDVVMVPGLGDQLPPQKKAMAWVANLWERRYGVKCHVVEPHWEEGTKFGPKLDLIVSKIDELYDKGHRVMLLGFSAGGSAVLNAFSERKDKK